MFALTVMSETVAADRNQMVKLSCNVDTTVQVIQNKLFFLSK